MTILAMLKPSARLALREWPEQPATPEQVIERLPRTTDGKRMSPRWTIAPLIRARLIERVPGGERDLPRYRLTNAGRAMQEEVRG